jgi:hypothetical protein
MAGFIEIIKLIQDGELVRAAITNRPTQQNDTNIRFLRDLFEAAMLGETVFARNRTVEKDTKVGMAVFYNAVTQQYERAQAGVDVSATGLLETTPATQVWGIVYRKLNDTLADILLGGTADVNLSQAIDGTPEPGKVYYLSGASKGKLVAIRPPVGVTVLQVAGANANGTHNVYVNTKFHDLLEAHRHYKIELVSEPAGSVTPPVSGERHVITSPDPDVEGWLPAGHATFGGKAPAGAAFGYNIAVSKLHHLWPPLPVEGAYLEWNKGEDKEMLGMGVPLGPNQLCVIDRNGIWWMSDCYDDVPWATNLTHNVSMSDSASTSVSIECPRTLSPVMLLWFTKPVFQTTGSCVLSLQAAENSGLSIVCVDTLDPARAGHLLIDLDLALVVVSDVEAGHLAFKALDTQGRIRRGPVVESLKAGSSNVSLTSNVTAIEDRFYGNVVIDVDLDLEGKEIAVDTVRLDGVEEEFYEDTIALGFRAGIRAGFRGRINIPVGVALPTGTQLKLRFWFLNRSTLDLPAELFTVTYRRLAAPATLATPASLPTSTSEVTLAAIPAANVAVASTANQYFTIETAAFDVAAGDTVHYTLERAGDEDGFSGNVQLLRQRGIYVAPTA